ncbi:MAG: signal peptidase I [Leptospiraceae bacterium]|nr:signal peptidase I [Leptospiraceae bacterium]
MLRPIQDLVPDKKTGIAWSSIVVALILAVCSAFLIRSVIHSFFFFPYRIKNDIMAPALVDGAQVTIHWGFSPEQSRIGTIVLYQQPGTPADGQYLMGRIVALPADKVELKTGQVWVNGAAVQTDWERAALQLLARKAPRLPQTGIGVGSPFEMAPLKIPAEHVFILSDNRIYVQDSRQLGPLDRKYIAGVVTAPD